MGVRGVARDAYFVAPSPTLYVIGAALTVFVTLEVVQAVVLSPNVAVAKLINTSFILSITLTFIYTPTG